MGIRSFPTTMMGVLAAFLVWAVHFMAIYGINGLVCARGLADRNLLGVPLSAALILGVTAVALLLAAAVLVVAVAGDGPAAHASREPRGFLRWFTIAAAAGALLAILWNGLPALQVPACG